MIPELALVFLSALAVLGGTAWLRRIAIARSWMDVPNARSSHQVPTPRGGGLAIAVVLLSATGLAAALGMVSDNLAMAIVVGGGATAAVGWLDDRRGLSPLARISVHVAAAVFAVLVIGGLPELRIGDVSIPLGMTGSVLAVVFVVWCLNLYNFMDGIDGLAGTEAVCVGLIGGVCSLAASGVGLVAFLVAACGLGFLVWNWAPARIFMGDAGSGLLGFCFALLALAAERSGGLPLLLWVVLLGVFAFDSTLTLLRRVARGERWYTAHRLHAYQRLVASGWSHDRVVLAIAFLNVILGALAVLAWRHPSQFGTCLAAAGLALFLCYVAVERRYSMYQPPVTGE